MQNISIVGGGLIGTLLSTYLAKRGHQINIYEYRSDIRKSGGIGGRSINLALSDRGWKALKAVSAELAAQMNEIVIPMYGRMIHTIDGTRNFQPYGKDGQAIYSVSRGKLNKILLEYADSYTNVSIDFHQKCKKVDVQNMELVMEDRQTKTTKSIPSDLIFGADGAFSAVRQSLQKTPRFNYAQAYLDYGYKELTIPATKTGDWQLYKNALHIFPRKNFMLIALPNTDGSFTCTLFLAYKGAISFEQLQTEEQIQHFFQTHFPTAVPLMPHLTQEFFDNPTSSLVTIYCDPWTSEGKVALVGDAAHAIVPFYGQGMNAGFEDCWVLDDLIEQHTTNGQTDWDEVFQAYQKSRIPDANAIAQLALRNFTEMRDLVTDEQFLLRKKIEKQLRQRYPKQYFPLYEMVTFSDMRYSEALKKGEEQDQLFERIFEFNRVEERWEAGELDGLIQEWMGGQVPIAQTLGKSLY